MTIEAGQELPVLVRRITRADVVAYAGASTDFNPIHWSDDAARTIGLPGVVAHGMLTMGSALKAVTDWVGDPARVTGYSVRFVKPVVVDPVEGAELQVSGRVTAVTDTSATITLDVSCGGEAVLKSAVVEVAL